MRQLWIVAFNNYYNFSEKADMIIPSKEVFLSKGCGY